MPGRAFPVVYAQDVTLSVRFFEALGFKEQFRMPQDSEPGYVGLRRGDAELAVVTVESPRAEQMPWGERVAYVADPDGNPVALADAGLV